MPTGSTYASQSSTAANVVRLLIVLSVATGVAFQFVGAHSGLNSLIYFTIQSNILLGLYHAWALVRQKTWDTRKSTILRGAVTLYIVITGSVYHILLAPGQGFSMGAGTSWIAWTSNLLLHTVTSVLAAIDWLAFGRARRDVPWSAALYWLAYPLAYMVFAFVRGAFTHDFPYFFLDLNKYSVANVAAMCVGLAIGFYLLGLAVVAIGKGMSRITTRQ